MSHLVDETTNGKTFADLKLSSWLVRQCNELGLLQPTPVQYNCIPSILKGEDCIASAKTGSGKTLAFALPILEAFVADPFSVFAVVIAPTRELAKQIEEQFKVLGTSLNLKVSLVVGGDKWNSQSQELENKPEIIVCTPGQLCYHIKFNDAKKYLRRVRFLVLDEADKLLSGYFDEHLGPIFEALPQKRQTLLFTATITNAITDLQSMFPTKPHYYEPTDPILTVSDLDQRYVIAPIDAKEGYVVQVLLTYFEKFKENNIIIFAGSRKHCHTIYLMLKELGFSCSVLHSLLQQNLRWDAISNFKSGITRILITTDLACRGLDIPVVNLVINFNVPDPENYIHRVGRTARAGKAGMAITFVTRKDVQRTHAIEAVIGTQLKEFKPNEKLIQKILSQVYLAKKESEIEMVDFDKKLEQYEKIEQLTTGKEGKLGNKRKRKPEDNLRMLNNKKKSVKNKQ